MSNAAMSNPPSRTRFTLPLRVIVGLMLALIGLAMSAWAYQFNSQGPIVTWGIFPGAPFVLLASLSLVKRIPLRVTVGAYIAGFLAIVLPYGAIWYDSLNYNGGGANIGLGIFALAALVLLPIPILIGGFIGWLIPTGKKEQS
ncbi:MAG: hypothetical protein MUF23_13585 [Pirellula sp.]|jgi:hypothetical protein|nr:hypothetical protein [Pirellula sp.]